MIWTLNWVANVGHDSVINLDHDRNKDNYVGLMCH